MPSILNNARNRLRSRDLDEDRKAGSRQSADAPSAQEKRREKAQESKQEKTAYPVFPSAAGAASSSASSRTTDPAVQKTTARVPSAAERRQEKAQESKHERPAYGADSPFIPSPAERGQEKARESKQPRPDYGALPALQERRQEKAQESKQHPAYGAESPFIPSAAVRAHRPGTPEATDTYTGRTQDQIKSTGTPSKSFSLFSGDRQDNLEVFRRAVSRSQVLGENGKKAAVFLYDGTSDPGDFLEDFFRSYLMGKRGEVRGLSPAVMEDAEVKGAISSGKLDAAAVASAVKNAVSPARALTGASAGGIVGAEAAQTDAQGSGFHGGGRDGSFSGGGRESGSFSGGGRGGSSTNEYAGTDNQWNLLKNITHFAQGYLSEAWAETKPYHDLIGVPAEQNALSNVMQGIEFYSSAANLVKSLKSHDLTAKDLMSILGNNVKESLVGDLLYLKDHADQFQHFSGLTPEQAKTLGERTTGAIIELGNIGVTIYSFSKAVESLAAGGMAGEFTDDAARMPGEFADDAANAANGASGSLDAVGAAAGEYADDAARGAELPAPEGVGDSLKAASFDDLPSNVQKSYNGYEGNGWKGNYSGQTPGTNAGSLYRNKNNLLPKSDSFGNTITYKEFDVNNRITGTRRDAERFIVGSDGSLYYTVDHYTTFTKIK